MAKLKSRNNLKLIAGVVALAGVVLLIVGIVLIAKANNEECTRSEEPETGRCGYSSEAKRAGLDKFLQKVQDTHFELHPQDLIFKPGGVKLDEYLAEFKPYNPEPGNLKRITDTARQLVKQLKDLGVNTLFLKPREKKALAQVKHYLQNNFGQPYDSNYYAGDFLMGPNLFCWQPICDVGHYDIRMGLGNLHPRDLTQLRVFLDKTKLVAHTFSTYIENLRIGVKAGMVRSKEECSAGLKSFKRRYLQVSLQGVKGMSCFLTKEQRANLKKKL